MDSHCTNTTGLPRCAVHGHALVQHRSPGVHSCRVRSITGRSQLLEVPESLYRGRARREAGEWAKKE